MSDDLDEIKEELDDDVMENSNVSDDSQEEVLEDIVDISEYSVNTMKYVGDDIYSNELIKDEKENVVKEDISDEYRTDEASEEQLEEENNGYTSDDEALLKDVDVENGHDEVLDTNDYVEAPIDNTIDEETSDEIAEGNDSEEVGSAYKSEEDEINDSVKEDLLDITDNNKNVEDLKHKDSVVEKFKYIKDTLVNKNGDKYISYNSRVARVGVLLLMFFGLTIFFILKSFSMTSGDSINYVEKSNLDYQVYLKENSFYETDHLGKDMLYVASLIDHINVAFDYNFTVDKQLDFNLTYDIIGKLTIADNSEKNIYFEKEYVLLEPVTETISNGSAHNINRNINIDYNYYNSLANNFRTSYGLDTSSNLIVYFRVKQDNGTADSQYPLHSASEMSVNIPLSERSVNIRLDYNEVNDSKQIISTEHLALTNYAFVILAIISFIAMIYFAIKLTRLIRYMIVKKSNYDKFVSKVLKEYDRLIVETTTAPVINDDIDVVKVNKFQELLDVRDNLKLPIKYYVVNKHQKCYFFISYEKELYLLTIKEVDLEEDNSVK